MWLQYLLNRLETLRDCFIGRAWDFTGPWRIENNFYPDEEHVNFIALAFGERSRSNEQLAQILDRIPSVANGCYKFAQWQVGQYCDPSWVFVLGETGDRSSITTREVYELMLGKSQELHYGVHKKDPIVVLSHPAHAWRACKILERMGFSRVYWKSSYSTVDFDPESDQWWTRSMTLWILREIPARIYHLVTGQI